MGMALSNAFQALRQGKPVDLDEVLRRIREQGLRELTLTDVTLPNGTRLGKAQIDTPEDAALFAELLREPATELAAPAKPSGWRTGKAKASGPLLSKAIADHLGDLDRAKLHSKTVLESRHSLRLFAGAVGARPGSVRVDGRPCAGIFRCRAVVAVECDQARAI
ncbi:integrase [Xanthomonas bromi]|uniref:Integrase n=1 Tax=Xanthomonas bromi TaxID=56449 RepID=A0A1C3NQ30_9XANT|nr:integrase [Xanthomonas bromi]